MNLDELQGNECCRTHSCKIDKKLLNHFGRIDKMAFNVSVKNLEYLILMRKTMKLCSFSSIFEQKDNGIRKEVFDMLSKLP